MKGRVFFYLNSLFFFSIIGYIIDSFSDLSNYELIVKLKGPWDLNIGLSVMLSFIVFTIFTRFWDFKSLKTRSLLQTIIDIIIIIINCFIFSIFFVSDYKYFISLFFSLTSYYIIFPNLYIFRGWSIEYFKKEEKRNEQNFLLFVILIPYILIFLDLFFLIKASSYFNFLHKLF